jgi:drug/metabolite transporter (DMT)-like permease
MQMTRPAAISFEQRSTILGVIAILFWSTTIAFSRSLTEQLGTFTASSLIYLTAGLIGIGYSALRPGWFSSLRSLPTIYIAGCGGLFVLYIVCLYLAIGYAATRSDVLAVGLINYLWPGLSLVFSIPILGKRGSIFLPLGILIALSGIWLATAGTQSMPAGGFFSSIGSIAPYLLALVAAIAWGLYTNFSRKWAGDHDEGAVPLFLLASGAFLACIRIFYPETTTWTVQAGFQLAYMALFPGMLAYVFWDLAVRKGNIILLASLSYITPLLSTMISAVLLKTLPGPMVWLGSVLVIAGAVICKLSVSDPVVDPAVNAPVR